MTLDDTPSRDDRLGEALLVCLEAADGGRPIDRESILARYPELSLELADFFASQDRVEPLAAPLRSVALAARLDTSPLALQTPPLGDFRLVREVGRGGMGIVYEAEQISLGRRVALKVLPFAATMDAKQLQRFKNEARAAAGLKHEHIVSVYAVGCERGVHFYSMEFIDGQTLAQIIHDLHAAPPASTVSEAEGKGDVTGPYQPAAPTAPVAALSTERSGPKGRAFYRTAATLIAGAADALEHAHGLGIVHRDVKPANLLVDAAGKVYVGDFGLARTGPDAGLTMTGDLIGTLRYMAPEQAMARHGLADHRVDVYGLGATLYELLTGQPAMAGDDKAEILKAIAFEEPVVPRKIDKGIPAELETIALKCLAKNPTERYATAGELADDLRRFAEDKPIMAKPSGFRERVAKWGRRHKYLVRSAVVVLAVTVVALAVSTVLVLREKVRTEERFQAARAAVDDMYTRVAEDWLDDAPHLTEVQREFLEKALQFYLRFGQDHSDAAAMQNETAQAHIRVGRIQTKLGKLAEAEAAFRQAIDRSETLVAVFPQEPKYRAVLAQAYQFLSTVLEAPAAFPEREQAALRAVELQKRLVVEVPDWPGYWPDLGDSYRLLGRWYEEARRPADAEPQCRQSLDIRERLAAAFPDNPTYQSDLGGILHNLAKVCHGLNNSAEAERLLTRAIEHQQAALKADPRRARTRTFLVNHWHMRAQLMESLGQFAEAELAYRAALEQLQRLVSDFPAVPAYRLQMVRQFTNQAKMLDDLKRHAEGADAARIARDYGRALVKQYPDSVIYQDALLEALRKLAVTSRNAAGQNGSDRSDRLREARSALQEARLALQEKAQVYERLMSQSPADPDLWHDLGSTLNDLAQGMIDLGEDRAAARNLVRRAIDLHRKALTVRPQRVVYQRSLCNNQLTLGRICKIEVDEHLRAGRIAEAEQSLLRLRDHGAALVAEFPDQSIVARGLGDTYINLGYFYRRINRTKDELAAWQAAVKYAPDFAPSHKHLGLALIRSGRRDEGLAAMHRAISLDPKFVEGYGDLGATLINLGRPKEALEPLQRAIELKPDAVIALHALGMALNVLGRAAEAEPYLRRAIQAQPSFAMAHYNLGLSLTATGRHGDAKAALGQAIALNPNDANSLGTLAWLLATCPDKNLRDATQAVELANKAVDLSRGSARFRRTLGVAHYRAGNWKGAITGIGESIDLKSEGDSVDWFFLSMAHWQLGERETAKKYYAQAVEWMEKNKPKDDELRRFRAEAAELLAIKQ